MHRRATLRLLGIGALLGCLALPVAGAAADEQGDGPHRAALEGPVAGVAKGAASDPAPRPSLPRLVTLREGAAAKLVQAVGFQPASYRQVHLRVENTSAEPLRVDVCGSHLVPKRRGSCQRLGLGPVVTPRQKKGRRTRRHPRPPDQPPGTVIIGLKAGETRTVHLWTCCLDAGKPAPSAQTFTVAAKALPGVREEALRWWADNPDAPQGAVNRAIWQFRPVDEDAAFATGRRGRTPRILGGNGVALHAGTVYRLRAGELMARDPDGIERFLGTQMDGVYPTDSAIYAVSWGTHPGVTRSNERRPRELWRLVPTGDEPWAHVATIGATLRIDRIHVSPSGAILALTDEGLFRVDRANKRLVPVMETQDLDNLSVSFTRRGMARVTFRRPPGGGYVKNGERHGEQMAVCEVWEVDPATGAKDRIDEFWNVRQVKTGPAGLYALSPGGKLRRLTGRSFRNAPGQTVYERILHVGRRYVWLESTKGRLVAADRTGRLRFEAGPVLPERGAWAVDPHDDRVIWRDGRRWLGMGPKDGKRLPLEEPERR